MNKLKLFVAALLLLVTSCSKYELSMLGSQDLQKTAVHVFLIWRTTPYKPMYVD